ncbi:hypothetical protein ACFL6S_31510 [Candidatus Poribacteria bacterium]
MRIYHVERDLEDKEFFFIVVNNDPNVCQKVFYDVNSAWKHAGRLAKRYAHRHCMDVKYTKHPEHKCSAYIVEGE